MARWPEPDHGGLPQALAASLLRVLDAGTPAPVHDDPCALAPPPTNYRVAWLELTVQGYALRRRVGWRGAHEISFTLRRPAWWQRLLGRTRPLACTLRAGREGVRIAFAPAARPAKRGVRNRHSAPGSRP